MSKYVAIAVVAAGAVLAAPVTGVAAKDNKGKAKGCAKATVLGYQVSGTLVGATADNPATPASEASVTIKVTSANSHARNSGEIADQNPAKKGVQVKGATYTVPAGDAFVVRVHGYEGTDTASVGDRVKISGKIARVKKSCAPAGTSLADRYLPPDVRTVTLSDRDPDA